MKNNDITERFDGYDRAVSPVIGVILMVAITVILAAVIGTFVLDLGQSAGNSAPSASLTVDTDSSAGNFTINHQGGDSLTDGDTRITVTNESDGQTLNFAPGDTDEVFSVGDSVVVNADASPPAEIGASGDVFTARTADSGSFAGVNGGTQYTIEVIDTESQRVIFETTVTA